MFKCRIAFGGVSIATSDDIPSQVFCHTLYKKSIGEIDYIFARDLKTSNFLKKLQFPADKFSLICDFAFFINPKKTARVNEIESVICGLNIVGVIINVSKLKHPKIKFNNAYFVRTLKFIRKLIASGFYVLLIPLSISTRPLNQTYAQDDREACAVINERLKTNLPILPTETLEPEEIIQIIKNLKGLISIGRLHGSIFGCLANVISIHIYFENKSMVLNNLVKDYPLFHSKEWLENPTIDDTIINLIKTSRVDYTNRIAMWRKRSLNEFRTGCRRLGIV